MEAEQIEPYWVMYGQKHLVGKEVKRVRYLSESEAEDMGWYKRPLIIEFTDGTLIFPSMDDEGNDGGALFGQTKDGTNLTFPVI